MSEAREKFWTKEMLERVRMFRLEGRSFGQIAGYVGASRSAVISVWHRRIARTPHPSRDPAIRRGDAFAIERNIIPSVCYVPGLTSNTKYTLCTVTHNVW